MSAIFKVISEEHFLSEFRVNKRYLKCVAKKFARFILKKKRSYDFCY